MSEVPAAAVEAAEAAIHASQAYWNCSQAAEVAVAVAAPLIRQATADEIAAEIKAYARHHSNPGYNSYRKQAYMAAAEIARRVGGGGGGEQ
jgi:hypothetical protein